MVRASTGLNGDEDRWKPLEEADHLGAPELAADNHDLILVNAVELEHRFGSIHADTDWNAHWDLLSPSCDAKRHQTVGT
jgi:hypothetical protein